MFSVFSVQGGHFSGIYRKVQLKPLSWVKVPKQNGEGEEERPVEALMVLKYGGVLTHAGSKQVCYCILVSSLQHFTSCWHLLLLLSAIVWIITVLFYLYCHIL